MHYEKDCGGIVVVSSTLAALLWQPATLVRSLLHAGLLDELSLNICPVVVGSGMHLFDRADQHMRLKVVHSTIFDNGIIGVTYQRLPSGERAGTPISFPGAAGRQ